MNITNVLSEEHQNILQVIDAVLNECNEIENGKEPDKDYFMQVVDFITNYADGYHHAKEEDILFKTMLENAIGMHCNPIPVMLHEHDEGRRFVKGLEEGLAMSDKEKILDSARGYCHLIQEHIYKEDNVLYPMAEETIPEEQKELVQQAYNRINSDVYPTELIQKYLRLVPAK